MGGDDFEGGFRPVILAINLATNLATKKITYKTNCK
jgi:hypothetical protein